ncbi:DUF4412 domain-containing protein [Kordia algicida OT-1]|uniref:DUF4412 domain-containing protein n=1 Tax=Kordia algicida OT-1 TaxID=391587 RepID=A9E7Z3_9FLAO|nr:DUF4412 domain-containing protein [Kordia algicida]EDP94948.1 hypothetical protein KAOT1_09044 [Kordia algicida OT-1]
MKTIFKMSACVCFFLAAQNANSQLLKRIQNKVENKVEQKVEEKAMEEAEKAADNMLDKVLGNKKASKNKNAGNSYTFNQSITLEMEADGNDKAQIEFLFEKKNPNIICMKLDNGGDDSGGQVYTVITPTSSIMFMDMPGMKIKKKVTNEELGQLDYADKVPQKSDLVKTGKTKTILGYTCHEYFYENDGGKVHAWVSNNFPIKGKFVPILGMKNDGPFEGFVMELNYVSSNESATMKVIKVDTNANVQIDASAYKSM